MDKHAVEQFLKQNSLFKGMTQDQIELLADCARLVEFEEGQVIFRQGESADTFYVVREGRIAVDIPAADRGTMSIQSLGAGDTLGWSWLFPPYLWHFDARAVEATSTIALDGKCLRGKCDADSAFGYEILKRFSAMVVERLQATRIQLLDMFGR
jgi:CRP-like cAMP-binding protein